MPMPDWAADPSMLYGGAGMMPPAMPQGLLAGGAPGAAPMPPPPVPAAPTLPGVTPQAAAQAGAPLTPQQQQAALAQAAQAFGQIRPSMPANTLNPMPGAGMPMPPAGGINPNLMQMLRMRLGAPQSPLMAGGMGIY